MKRWFTDFCIICAQNRKLPPPPSLHAYRPDDKVLRERYSVGDNVRNYGNGPKWMSSVVIEQRGPLSYTVQLKSGLLCRDTKISWDSVNVSPECDVEANELNSWASTEEFVVLCFGFSEHRWLWIHREPFLINNVHFTLSNVMFKNSLFTHVILWMCITEVIGRNNQY